MMTMMRKQGYQILAADCIFYVEVFLYGVQLCPRA